MQDRSIGVIAMTAGSVAVGLYCQLAGVALLIAGSVHQAPGTVQGLPATVTGVAFLGLAIGAYAVAYGFWARRPWSPALGTVLAGALVVTSVLVALVSANLIAGLLPFVAGAVTIWYLHKPATRLELLGVTAPTQGTVSIEAPARAARLVR